MLNDSGRSMPLAILGQNLTACHRCRRRQANCSGPCACLEDGRDIVEHAQEGDCPLGRHQTGKAAGLGDVVADWARKLGAERAAAVFHKLTGRDCGCKKRREQLNRIFPFIGDGKDR
jgi:hypothetical protein